MTVRSSGQLPPTNSTTYTITHTSMYFYEISNQQTLKSTKLKSTQLKPCELFNKENTSIQ